MKLILEIPDELERVITDMGYDTIEDFTAPLQKLLTFLLFSMVTCTAEELDAPYQAGLNTEFGQRTDDFLRGLRKKE